MIVVTSRSHLHAFTDVMSLAARSSDYVALYIAEQRTDLNRVTLRSGRPAIDIIIILILRNILGSRLLLLTNEEAKDTTA